VRHRTVRSPTVVSSCTTTLIAIELDFDRTACHHPFGTTTASPGTITTFTHNEESLRGSWKGSKSHSQRELLVIAASP